MTENIAFQQPRWLTLMVLTDSQIKYYIQLQWWIQDFPEEGAPTYDFAIFPQKLHEIERISAPRGVSLAPPPFDPPLNYDIELYRHNQMKEELINNLDVALDRLRKIWDEIGIIGEQRKDRTHVI